jgi:catechol 2,3-dioxygenase-like lactoylglutathione lyase family enzyme
LTGVLETVLYFTDPTRTEAFYSDVLGMRLLEQEPGRGLFYRAGRSVFLLFGPEAARSGAALPPHGATGSIHVCFRVAPADYEPWKRHLAACGVTILREVDWPNGGASFYFHDPDGHLLEMANADIWPP